MAKSLATAQVLGETRDRLYQVTAQDRALWGTLTAPVMMRHLAQAYEIALGERQVGPVRGLPQGLMKWVALRSWFQWPKNIQTTPELHLANAEACHEDFDSLIEETVEKLEQVARGRGLATSHPFFGSMTAEDWMRWGYLHADHHLRQFGR
ncbi:hypothetical protein BH10ACI4_BH10ACI4_17430 [soil metagenome]